jgi:hypothetical protein
MSASYIVEREMKMQPAVSKAFSMISKVIVVMAIEFQSDRVITGVGSGRFI